MKMEEQVQKLKKNYDNVKIGKCENVEIVGIKSFITFFTYSY